MFQKEFEDEKFSFIFVSVDEGDNMMDDVRNFIKNKNAFFFSASDFGKKRNLNRVYREMSLFFEGKKVGKEEVSLDDVCKYIIKNCITRRIIVIENVEELFGEEDFLTVEKLLKELKNTNNMLILISKNATFTNKFYDSKLTKYLCNSQMKAIDNFYTLKNDQLSAEDNFKYYAVFGNKKEYRKKIDYTKSLEDNLSNTFFNVNGCFYFEPQKILKKELRETQLYNVILEAISKGASTLADISEETKMPTGICNKYLTVLISLGIVNKVKPAFRKETRKSRYKISNPVMNFWYYFIPDNMSRISLNNGKGSIEDNLFSGMDNYLEMKFPELCREYINELKKDGKIKIDIKENNVWWDKDKTIDVVAGGGLEAIVGDCFWRKDEVSIDEFYNLEKKAKDLDVIDREYYLFSKSGFSRDLIKLSKSREDIKLVEFSDMIGKNNTEEKPRKISFFFSRK